MRNQPIATTKDKLENHDFKTMINGVLGSLRDASKDPEGRKMESRLGNALRLAGFSLQTRQLGLDLFHMLGLA